MQGRLTYDMPAPNWHSNPDNGYKCPKCNTTALLRATNMGVLGVGITYKCSKCNWSGIQPAKRQ